MSVKKLYVIQLGYMHHDLGMLLAGKSGPTRSPMGAYLIETDEGFVLYDTGPDPKVLDDAAGTWKGLLKIVRPEMRPEDTIVGRLEEIGLQPADIKYVVMSHLHFDHAGGLRFFKESKIIVHRAEYRFAHFPDPYFRGGYLPSDFNHANLNWEFIDGDMVLVDGLSIILTHGHCPGHLSLMLDLSGYGPVVLAGDAIQLEANAKRMILSGTCWNQALATQAILRLKAIAQRNKGRIWPGHDIQFWDRLKKSPEYYN